MRALITLMMVPLTLCIAGVKAQDYSSLKFAGGACWTCQEANNGDDCCDQGSKPTVGQGCSGSSGASESDCNGAKGRFCSDSGIEQSKTCDDDPTEDCIKGFSYTCVGGSNEQGPPTPPVWVKGDQNVDCGTKRLCSME